MAGEVQSLSPPTPRAFQGPDDYEVVLPFALEDVNLEYSRAANNFKVFGYDAINNMILNVIYTRIGERDFEPTFGSNIIYLIHEPNDAVIPDVIEIELYDRLRTWVPYIDIAIAGIVVRPIYDQQSFRIGIIYFERQTNIQRTFITVLSR